MKSHVAAIFGHRQHPRDQRGQVLLEVLIALAAVATISATIATLIIVAQRGQENAKRRDAAANIAAEVFTAISAMANADIPNVTQGYNRIYCVPDGVCERNGYGGYAEADGKDPTNPAHRYHPVLVGNHFELATGEITEELADFDFTHYVTVENVCRENGIDGTVTDTWVSDPAVECPNGALDADDPYNQKVTATFQSPGIEDIVFSKFITRSRSAIQTQSSWSGAEIPDGAGNSVVEFQVDWTNDDDADMLTDPVKIFICKSDQGPVNLSCPAGSWTETPSFTSASPEFLYYSPTPADAGQTHNYWVFVCDIGELCSSPGGAGSFTVN